MSFVLHLTQLAGAKVILWLGNASSLHSLFCTVVAPCVSNATIIFLSQTMYGPFLFFQSGCCLTLSSVMHLLRDSVISTGLPHKSPKGHSFFTVGLPDQLIKVLGCSSSDCYQIYIGTPESTAAQKVAGILGNFVQFWPCFGGCMPSSFGVACVLQSHIMAFILSDLTCAMLGR